MTRHFCRIPLALLLMLGATAAPGQTAAPWPTKPVQLIVPGAAGVAPDIMARLLGEKLSKMWNQPVIVENRPGAGGLIGFQAAKTLGKDDHTFIELNTNGDGQAQMQIDLHGLFTMTPDDFLL